MHGHGRETAAVAIRAEARRRSRWRLRVLLGIAAFSLVLFVISRLEPDRAKSLGFAVEAVYLIFNPPSDPVISTGGQQFAEHVRSLRGQAHLSQYDRGFLGIFGRVERYHVMIFGPRIGDAELASLTRDHADRIVGLQLFDTAITDNGLRHLKELPYLSDLMLMSNRGFPSAPAPPSLITDAGIAYLDLPNLRSLNLSGLPITDQGIKSLAGLSNLRTLYLSRTKVQGSTLGQLASLPNLVNLYLDDTAVTDQDLTALSGAANLQFLSLDGVSLTAAGLKNLMVLPRLKQLELHRNGLLDEEVRALKVKMPAVKIDH